MAAQHGHQLAQLVCIEESGGAAAQVQLHGFAVFAQPLRDQGHFFVQVAQVFGYAGMVLGDDLVAGTEVAQRLAKGQVHVNGQGRVFWPACPFIQIGLVGFRGKTGVKAVCGGVRGVAWPRHIKP